MKPKTYIGDAVYAEVNQWGQIALTTGANAVYLEQEVWHALLEFMAEPPKTP